MKKIFSVIGKIIGVILLFIFLAVTVYFVAQPEKHMWGQCGCPGEDTLKTADGESSIYTEGWNICYSSGAASGSAEGLCGTRGIYKVLEGADRRTFKVLERFRAEDKNFWYEKGKKTKK